ncbi:MAG: hypothetical protein GXP46_03950, partial [Deferribacteres bacterium]|nr:hypothetical protein [Deferribacteres bacterium]
MNLEDIPSELRKAPFWLCWTSRKRADGHLDKVPAAPWRFGDNRPASVTDSANYASFENAVAAAKKKGVGGLMFAFSPQNPYAGLDLDHCLDEAGKPNRLAQEALRRFSTYCEVSPSGHGLHFIFRLADKSKFPTGRRKGHLEFYSGGRGFTLTGKPFDDQHHELKDESEELLAFLKEHDLAEQPSGKGELSPVSFDRSPLTPTDLEALARLRSFAAKERISRLWGGDFSDFPSQSEADLSLMNSLLVACNGNRDQAIKLFLHSGLSRREKARRPDYLSRTIAKAAASYQPDEEVFSSPLPSFKLPNPLALSSFVYPTEHLPHFEEFSRLLRLQGKEYAIVRKAFYYQAISLLFRKSTLWVGDLHTDLRVHAIYALPSGSGKSNILFAQEKLCRALGLVHSMPASFHPEALVGKVLRQGKKEPSYQEIRGPLNDDWLSLNESIDLIRSTAEKAQEIRKYLNTALDPYGQNLVVKRMTDLPPEHALSYMPSCIASLFLQPFKVSEEAALVGTLRRAFIVFPVLKQGIDPIAYSQRLSGGSRFAFENALREAAGYLKTLKQFAESDPHFI